jgi:hypothetical protein
MRTWTAPSSPSRPWLSRPTRMPACGCCWPTTTTSPPPASTTAQPSLLIVDEFSALAGGRRMAIDLLERGRGASAGVVLAGQSTAALGTEDERARLLAAASAVIAFRSPQPAELAGFAGSTREAEAAWQLDGEDLTGRQTITMRSKARVDQDAVRAAPAGEGKIIAGGRVEAVRIIKTSIQPAVREQAWELVAGLTRPRPAGAAAGNPAPSDGPAGAVDVREVPPPVQPRQGASPAPRRPSGGLDPSGRSSVRRRRPPQVGPGSPPDDRMPGEVVPEP